MESLIKDSLVYVQSQQLADGSFITLSSSNSSFKSPLQFHTVFSTALILQCLTMVPKSNVCENIQAGCVRFLMNQKSKHWSWNYWQRESPEAKKMPYPDDLDDTFCAAAALFLNNPQHISPGALAKLVTLLTLQEEREGGPYRTWLVGEEADPVWRDTDIAVNSNIGYFLSLHKVTLPSLNRYFREKIEKRELQSPYYPSIYPTIYFLSRFYKRKSLQKLLLEKQQSGYWEHPLNTALAVLSLLNLGVSPLMCSKGIDYLQETYKGYWKPYPFYTGVNPSRSRAHVSGSSALTTAFCVAAFSSYVEAIKEQPVIQITKEPMLQKEEALYQAIVKKTEERWLHGPKEIQRMALPILKKIQKKEIVLLSYYAEQSFQKSKQTASDAMLIRLGIANTSGWLAYSIYDRFLDGDVHTPALLSIANMALRDSVSIYERLLPENKAFIILFHRIMDELEIANAWEVTHCRLACKKGATIKPFSIPNYENYQQLAQKSFGHALGPLALLFARGYTDSSAEVKQLMSFFRSYLTARQLHDDAHDFVEDCQRGHISAVCAMVLRKQWKNNVIPAGTVITDSLPALQEQLWENVILTVCAEIQNHINQAKKAMSLISLIAKPEILHQLLVPLERGVQQALKQRQETIEFLQTYSPSTS